MSINFKNISIPIKIISVVAVILVFFMVIENAIVYRVTYNKMVSTNKQNMKLVSNEVYENFKNLIKIQISDVEKNALNDDIVKFVKHRNNTTREEFKTTYKNEIEKTTNKLKIYAQKSKTDEHVFITDKDGVIIADSNSEFLNTDLSQNEYTKQALSGETSVSSVYMSVVNFKPVVTFSQPIMNENANVIGIAGKSVYIDYFSERFDKFKFLEDGFLFVVDSSQNIIYHPDKHRINKKLDIPELVTITKDNKSFKNIDMKELTYKKGKDTFSAFYISVPELKSLVVLTVNQNNIKSASNLLGNLIVLMTFIMLLVMVPLCYIFIRKIMRPMKVLVENTVEISKGNLTVGNEIKSNDEIGKLSRSFNSMTENIKSLVLDVKKVTEELLHINKVTGTAQQNIVLGMDIITQNTQLVSRDTDKLNSVINVSVSSFEAITKKVQNIKEQSTDMYLKAENIKNINNINISTVTSLKHINKQSTDKLKGVNKSFKELYTDLMGIKNIVDVVNNISKRTHILSLNASIEAASAGQYGTGFSVVAREIRNLSEGIVEQMCKIQNIVISVDNNMAKTEMSIDEVNRVFNEQDSAINDTIGNYQKALCSTEDIVSSIGNIDLGIETLNNENSSVINKLKEVNSICCEFTNSVNQISSVIENQYTETVNMDGLVQQLENSTNELREKMNKFSL
ncbi:methyl-accepting chemotaxis protein [Clostridium tagluense]|uniref:methyl-accepting chemotaxis protein n=1 Tax=Clostridium tagluense TaxID=360422 RepID=UPI001CF3ACFC|nr:methyl-accepting chemotaxis protein [Clostridium tagluense]MCB2314154.1 methyl-accepting chemotaxis protein [Clostridium tagluense]MCB2318981.1 methyl-accepting chemotaxis protein [Clostridium tagluense]MCB2323887.1 methyl-accepting chemotaxis protein [Clostridium tagluense]MCB2328712.1 methyl-accepting chemotaxis protein [Clostridium tagluense]MCB2333613.1 methyl-accepting chemotaxis protein [Clostridium tagluense]